MFYLSYKLCKTLVLRSYNTGRLLSLLSSLSEYFLSTLLNLGLYEWLQQQPAAGGLQVLVSTVHYYNTLVLYSKKIITYVFCINYKVYIVPEHCSKKKH